ncbi:hypothetical protein H6G18_08810 [Anabaena subtropica FACHB-260]|uniref:Uncharacterized protein n=1 Tax=Anabaena subtropica FACHB-260 TaxID=2692884 RepID=A0ABR8CNW5_9NOST|nr:hypothetical protein [Anabaena subtropica FACHB-260]
MVNTLLLPATSKIACLAGFKANATRQKASLAYCCQGAALTETLNSCNVCTNDTWVSFV